MRNGRICWRAPLGVALLLTLLGSAGVQAAGNFLTALKTAGRGSIEFRLSGDGNWFVYSNTDFDEEEPAATSTIIGPGGTETLPGSIYGISDGGKVIIGADNSSVGYVRQDGVTTTLSGTPNAVSRDGRVVVGQAGDGWGRAFRWSDGVLTDLGVLPGAVGSNATLLSADGRVITGDSHVGNFDIAVVWANGATTPTALGSLGGIGSYAFAISADGSTIVGRGDTGSPPRYTHAYRWTAGVMTDLGVFAGGNDSQANAVSADGSVVAGSAEIAPGQMRAFRWTGTDGMVDLGSLGGSNKGSGAYAISDDGSVVVGSSDLAGGGTTGFRWDIAGEKMVAIADFLTDAGLDVAGWTFSDVHAISADGRSMAGNGSAGNERGVWYARCSADNVKCHVMATGPMTDSFAGLGALGESGNNYLEADFAALGGALDHAGPGTSATAYGSFDSDPARSAGIVVSFHPTDALVAAIGLDTATIDTPLAFGGGSSFGANALTVSLASLPEQGLNWRVNAAGAMLNGTIVRGYLDGATPVTSSGDASGVSAGVEALAGWRAADLLAYASLGIERTSYAGWTETGGPFPAVFGSFFTIDATLRAGVRVDHDFGKGVSASGGIALVHRQTGGSLVSGVIPRVFGIGVAATPGPADWVELTGGLALPLPVAGQTQVDVTLRLPASGRPSIAGRFGLQLPL